MLVTWLPISRPTGWLAPCTTNSTTNTFRWLPGWHLAELYGRVVHYGRRFHSTNGGTTGAQFFSTAYSMPANHCTQGRAIHLVCWRCYHQHYHCASNALCGVGGTQIGQAAATYTPTASQPTQPGSWTTPTCRAAPSAASRHLRIVETVATQLTPLATAAVTCPIVPSNFAGVNVATQRCCQHPDLLHLAPVLPTRPTPSPSSSWS